MPQASLDRTLRSRDLIFIVVGTVIGSGIFVVPGAVLRQTGGDVGYALVVWVLGGTLSLLGALTYGELGGMLPEAGGAYVYVRDAFGPLPAFLLGWTLFFVISSGSVATLAVAFAEYLRQFVPLDPTARKLAAALMIAVVGAVNVRGTRHSANIQNWSTGIKVAAILAISVVLLGSGHGLADLGTATFTATLGPSLLSGVGVAMIGVLWAYEGWAKVAASAGEALEPQRGFPRGIVIGTATLVAIYLLANVAYVAALGPAAVVRTDRVAADAVRASLGPGAGRLIAAAVLVAMFSAANGLTLTNSRVYYAMARDGVFFRKLAEVHPRFGTPAFSVLVSSAWAIGLAATGSFEQLFTYVIFSAWIFYALAGASVFVLRRSRPDAPRPFRVPGYPWTPLVFVVSAAAIVLNTIWARPQRSLLGLGIVALGLPAYRAWRRAHPRPADG
ncbi:MAG: amino acid transporter [Gemmatimonadetes bacterium]|nr:MAG: amino acid transporter [Gemmatimonadota bacterium]